MVGREGKRPNAVVGRSGVEEGEECGGPVCAGRVEWEVGVEVTGWGWELGLSTSPVGHGRWFRWLWEDRKKLGEEWRCQSWGLECERDPAGTGGVDRLHVAALNWSVDEGGVRW